MIARRLLCAAALAWAAAGAFAPAAQAQAQAKARADRPAARSVPILYLSRADDPDYRPQRRYTGLILRQRRSPIEGARLAIRGARVKGRALGLKFALVERELREDERAEDALAAFSGAALLDLPLGEFRAAVAAAGGREDLILFNIRHPDDDLRGAACAPSLLHVLPSRAMLTDALAQFLRAARWPDALMLTDEADPDSAAFAAAFRASARKFGLRVVGDKAFELTNDPRRRDRSNIALLTMGDDYDVVFLADETGEFGRYVPYATQAPRPVVGSEGLRPLAWHWTWERHGAPQLGQRFRKRAGRDMTGADWAAWAAVRALVEAVARTKETDAATLRAWMTSEDFRLDLYKGAPGRFRPWSGQLNQPILLATANAVIARAPLPGFLHRFNNLDTLGADRADAACPLARP